MKPGKPAGFFLVGLILVAGPFSAIQAQTAPVPGQTVPTITNGLAHESAASSAARSPGLMVSAGIASAQNAVKQGRTNAAEITATAPETDTGFFAQIRTVLQQVVNNLLVYFVNLFLERAGLPPVNGNFNFNTNDNTNTNTNTNTNSNNNANDNTNDNSNANDNSNDNSNTNGNTNSNTNANQNDNTARPGGLRKNR